MTKLVNLTKWEYQLTYNVPVTIGADGSIEWEEHYEYCVINLPASVENPSEFLKKSGYDDQVDIIDFADFSKIDA